MFIHSTRHRLAPYARDTLFGTRHGSRSGSEHRERVETGPPPPYFLPAGFSFLSAALPAGALPAAGAAFFCRGAPHHTIRGSVYAA